MSMALASAGAATTAPYPGAAVSVGYPRSDKTGTGDTTGTDDGTGTTATDQATTGKKQDAKSTATKTLSDAQQRQVVELKARDTAVRAHEAAHQSTGGNLTGAVSFSYQTGPDGHSYAVGGDVPIDISSEKDPAATISKMERVQAAALAPADPSSQDMSVAAKAAEIAAQAQLDLAKARTGQAAAAKGTADKTQNTDGTATSDTSNTSNTQQQRATKGYSQASATIIPQMTGSGLDASA